jgi:hypothetical protein
MEPKQFGRLVSDEVPKKEGPHWVTLRLSNFHRAMSGPLGEQRAGRGIASHLLIENALGSLNDTAEQSVFQGLDFLGQSKRCQA